ncbi:hypothetical protein [Streptomyces sp. NRRL B-24720]|uniref:hypothetical protein n=1 Tax=Streptomyces sp. NRRL B-24720 TaxID=1476876 RepID=UPI00131B9325|nr:hypothetical protein [Streptomyces sp. NRRL B-24720]
MHSNRLDFRPAPSANGVGRVHAAVRWTGPGLGAADGHEMRTAVAVGHDICGFPQFATVPVVTVETPRQVLRHEVRARYRTPVHRTRPLPARPDAPVLGGTGRRPHVPDA